MKSLLITVSCLLSLSIIDCGSVSGIPEEEQISMAFYNTENFFDTIDDPETDDKDFTPSGKNQWNSHKYKAKVKAMSKVFSFLGNGTIPDLLGLCEVENKFVLNDVLANSGLSESYGIITSKLEDERGMETALIWQKSKFSLLETKSYPIIFRQDPKDKTRPVLYVLLKQLKDGDSLHLLICHFPSRRGGKNESEYRRIRAAEVCLEVLKEKCDPRLNHVIICGDFNDEPDDSSMRKILKAGYPNMWNVFGLYNLMLPMAESGKGSYKFKGKWEMLDQMIFSGRIMFDTSGKLKPVEARIVNEKFLMGKGKYSNSPKRNFAGPLWLNGFSDHLPVQVKFSL